jgi:chemotaxis protein methyltransferase CheR
MHNSARPDTDRLSHHSAAMTEKDFRLFSKLIEGVCGIKMPDVKKHMLESRLRKRLRSLDMHSFRDYYDFLTSAEGRRIEMVPMIDAVTTNKTDFFREPAHFTYLTEKVLPELLGTRASNRVKIWSAGCSSGEEPYTLAMVLSEYARNRERFTFSILATDICTSVLETAHRGIYEEEKIAPVPHDMRKRYLLRSKDRNRGVVRMAPEMRTLITFRRLNFLDNGYGIPDLMQIIFCRNVLIYFDRPTQERVINNFCSHLQPGGHLFLGHSETINGLNVPLVQVNSTIYRKPS